LRIFFSAGEASGDVYAGALAEAILKAYDDRKAGQVHTMADALRRVAQKEAEEPPPIRFEGLGGPQLAKVGGHLVADTSTWGAIGILQSLKVVPRALQGYRTALGALRGGKPGLFIPIDFGFLNIRLARHAKRLGWKVLYFIPPGSWRKDRQGEDLPKVTDAIVTPFSWSADILRRMGAHAHWFGHPMKEIVRSLAPEGLERDGFAILPGSRNAEIEHNLPVIAQAMQGLPPATFVVAPNLPEDQVRLAWFAVAPDRKNDRFTKSPAPVVLARAQASIVCSGTATLQAALCRCPMVVVYRVSRNTEREAKLLRVNPKFISLPNIFLDRMAVPELIQHDATAERIREELWEITKPGETREAQLAAFEELDLLLGPDNAITRAAHLALDLCAAEADAAK
jgi:lipid-A-disaccharide synthase